MVNPSVGLVPSTAARHPEARFPYILAAWALLLALAPAGQAQTARDSLEERFARATARYGEQYVRLRQSRGYDPGVGSCGGAGEVPVGECDSVPLEYDIVQGLVYEHLPSSGLLFYSPEAGGLDVWLVTATGAPAFARVEGGADSLRTAHSRLRRAMRVDELQASRAPRFRGVETEMPGDRPALDPSLDRVTDLLLPHEIRGRLAGLDGLVVVPAGEIGTVPFAALRPFGTDGALVDSMTVSIAPSLPDFVATLGREASQRANWTPTNRRFGAPLVVGGPAFRPDGQDPHLPSLPGSAAEAYAVGRLVGSVPLIGSEARLDTVRARMRTASLLYFATHGVSDPESPLDGGGLYFAGDERLSVREIQNTPLDAAYLVVLSACQTGLGRADSAGVVGLARAFTLQGARHVVMSLWSVDDAATTDLMTAFMTRLLATCGRLCDVPGALRVAQLAARERWPDDPARWASFVHFGVPPRRDRR